MHYREYTPYPLLAPYIRCYWMLRAATNPFASSERLIPDGAVELIFNFGEPYQRINSLGQSTLINGSHLVGPRAAYYLIDQLGAIDHVAIRFAPGGLHRLFGLPLLELSGQTYPIEQIWGSSLQQLEEQLFSATDDQARCALINTFLLRRLEQENRDPALFTFARRLLRQHPTGVPIRQLANASNCSPRTLERTFLTWTGYTPKQYSQITRFLNLLNTLHRTPFLVDLAPTWTTFAHNFGYYDHAHMNKDFLHYTGLSPTDYIAHAHWIATQVAAHDSAGMNADHSYSQR
jgi:AraC-like DNA-binding protein